MSKYLVTGATGFVGSHIAEAMVKKGWQVVTVARASSDTKFLDSLGVQIVRGDLTEPETIEKAMAGVKAVVNSAAKVGDWGPVEEYRKVNVESVALLLEACRRHPVERFVQISSLGVYEARDHQGTDETVSPPKQHMDGYTQTKVEAEDVVMGYHKNHGIPTVILRPGFVYGPRDRTVLPRLIDKLRRGKIRYIGSKTKRMNTIHVANIVAAVFLALEKKEAIGEIFNITDDEEVTKQRFMETICTETGLTPPRKTVPYFLAKTVAGLMERIAKLRRAKQAPAVTRAQVKFMGQNLHYSCEKAKTLLGYKPQVKFAEGMKEMIAWWKANGS
jgi:nucleoside-diphosphate-sugar epimerase